MPIIALLKALLKVIFYKKKLHPIMAQKLLGIKIR
jgi:hypothetical protein